MRLEIEYINGEKEVFYDLQDHFAKNDVYHLLFKNYDQIEIPLRFIKKTSSYGMCFSGVTKPDIYLGVE